MNEYIAMAIILTVEVIFHLLAIFLIYRYTVWEQEQALIHACPTSFDISHDEEDGEDQHQKKEGREVEGGEPTVPVTGGVSTTFNVAMKREEMSNYHQTAAKFRAIFIWLVAAALVTDWTMFLFLGIALLLFQSVRKRKQQQSSGRLPDWQLRVYIFSMLALFALLFTTLAMMFWTCHYYIDYHLWGEPNTSRYRNISLGGSLSFVVLGIMVISACSNGHGPSQTASQESLDNCIDPQQSTNQNFGFVALT